MILAGAAHTAPRPVLTCHAVGLPFDSAAASSHTRPAGATLDVTGEESANLSLEFCAANREPAGVVTDQTSSPPPPPPHQRRPRYSGKYPRRFEEKYKELHPARYAETVAKVLAAGKTPAGMHRPVMVAEVLQALAPQPGEIAVDCTLGFGGHAQELLARIQPGGRLLGLDADPVELPKAEARLRALGFAENVFTARRFNFAGLPQALFEAGLSGADIAD